MTTKTAAQRGTAVSVKSLAITAICLVLVYVFTAVVNIRLPFAPNGGLIHLGNVPLFVAAILFGKRTGMIAGGIGMALFEDVTYEPTGRIMENSFMQYKIPTRLDMGRINVEFETSYEPSGPFGVKSIGEIVINTPAPALAHAIYRATGVWHRTVPFTPEKILMSMLDPQWKEIDRRVKES